MNSKNMLILGIAILGLGTIFGTLLIHKSNRAKNSRTIQELKDSLSLKNNELQKKQDQLQKSQNEFTELQKISNVNTKSIENITENNKELAKQNLIFSKQSSQLTSTVKDILTGGSGYLLVEHIIKKIPYNKDVSSGSIIFYLKVVGNYTMRNVKIKISHENPGQEANSILLIRPEEQDYQQLKVHVSEITIKFKKIIGKKIYAKYEFEDNEANRDYIFNIDVEAENGKTSQRLKISNPKAIGSTYYTVVRRYNQVLFERTEKNPKPTA